MTKALVTGGSRGIGFAIAKKLAEEGYSVVITARHEAQLKEAVNKLPVIKDGQKHTYEVLDLSNPKLTFEVPDSIDVLVNNAGVDSIASLVETESEETARVLQVNVAALVYLTKSFAKQRISQGKAGDVINISSVLAVKVLENRSVYSATKAAVESLMRSWAVELGPKNIKVNNVAPGLTETEMTASFKDAVRPVLDAQPINKGLMVQPEGIADAVLHFIQNRFLTGSTLFVDNGGAISVV